MDDTLLSSTLAGLAASVAEPLVTYPLEYLKTREQLAIRPSSLKESFSIPNYTKVCYSGCSAFIAGNAAKSFVRFQTFNWATKFMSDGKPNTAPQIVVAGMITGVAESLLVVPFENIKTRMVEASALGFGAAKGALPIPGSRESQKYLQEARAHHNNNNNTPKSNHTNSRGLKAVPGSRPVRPKASPSPTSLYNVNEIKGFRNTVANMWHQRGLLAFIQGFNPTIFRQVANSSVRFTSYNFLRQLISPEENSIGLGMSVGLAGATAFIEVAVTQPIDVIKTRMQTTNAPKLYGNGVLCSLRIFMEEGPKQMWAGALPRWFRVWISGGIMFIVYEQTNRILSHDLKERPFAE